MRLTDSEMIDMLGDPESGFSITPMQSNPEGITVDLRLSNRFKRQRRDLTVISPNMGEHEIYEDTEISEQLLIKPHEIVLGVTMENVTIPSDCVGWLDGRSSLARLGICVHVTAGRIDPGWKGNIVLELCNASNNIIVLDAFSRIAALSLEKLSGPVAHPYTERKEAKYANQSDVVGSRLNSDRGRGMTECKPVSGLEALNTPMFSLLGGDWVTNVGNSGRQPNEK